MKVEVSCFVGGMVIKEIVHVDKFEDADQVAKARNPFCRVVNRSIDEVTRHHHHLSDVQLSITEEIDIHIK